MNYDDDEIERMKARKSHKGTNERVTRRKQQASAQEYSSHRSGRNRISRQEKERRRRKKKRTILFIEVTILCVLLLIACFAFKDKDKNPFWTIAVFGVDSRDGNLEKGALSDVEMICTINKETGEIKLVSVFRDTYLKIDQKGTYHKINEAYFKGGSAQAVAALEENLDIKIDDYATFNWKAVADTINILGGIDLEITDKEFKYINSFITETVESTGIASQHLKSAGMNHLDGVQAVAYARLRLMDTDFNRTERQRKVVALAMEKAKQADFAALNNILVTVLPQVSTSIGINDLIPMAKNVKKYHLGETGGFPFSRSTAKISKRDCVIPTTLESNVIQLHEFLYGDTNYTPSSTVKKISHKIAEDSGLKDVGTNAPSGKKKPKKSDQPLSTEATTITPSETESSIAESRITESSVEETTEEVKIESTGENQEKPTLEDGSLVGPGADLEENFKPTETDTAETAESIKPNEAQTTLPATTENEVDLSETTDNELENYGPGIVNP